MSLNTAQFKADLKVIYQSTYESEGTAEAALDAFLTDFTNKLEVYIKTAVIVYSNGLTASVNPVVGTFNGHIE